MFTKAIYRQYFLEIHHKQREMIIMLHQGIDKISDDRTQKALAWHMKREIRLAVMVQKMVRFLSYGSESEEDQAADSERLDQDNLSLEVMDKEIVQD
jgi:hypothetical protein